MDIAIGTAVRLTTSIGDSPATPATAMITAAIGETLRAILVANCMGKIMLTALTPTAAETSGTRPAKAKNGAFPEPIRTAAVATMPDITAVNAPPLIPRACAPSITPVINDARHNGSECTAANTESLRPFNNSGDGTAHNKTVGKHFSCNNQSNNSCE